MTVSAADPAVVLQQMMQQASRPPKEPDVLRYERVQESDEELGGQSPQTSAYMPIIEDETTGTIVDIFA
jgi:hypothetical protein